MEVTWSNHIIKDEGCRLLEDSVFLVERHIFHFHDCSYKSITLRIRTLKHIGFGSGPDPCVSVSGPTPAMESPRILRACSFLSIILALFGWQGRVSRLSIDRQLWWHRGGRPKPSRWKPSHFSESWRKSKAPWLIPDWNDLVFQEEQSTRVCLKLVCFHKLLYAPKFPNGWEMSLSSPGAFAHQREKLLHAESLAKEEKILCCYGCVVLPTLYYRAAIVHHCAVSDTWF